MSGASGVGKTVQFSTRRSAPPQLAHYLTVVQGVTIERAVPVTAETLILGRDPSRAFHLPDSDVSRSHCEVFLVGDDVYVRDLGSTNGTFVDGVRVAQATPLRVSSRLEVGRHTFRHELLSPEDVARHQQFAKDLELARRHVEALLPAPRASGPVRTDWCFVPSSVLGGDALGYHDLGGGRLALYLLDVCGHGVASAMYSSVVFNAVRCQTLPDTDFGDPAAVLARLNDAFQMDAHNDMYFSIFYGVLDPASRSLRYSSAGHPPAIVLGADGRIRSRLVRKNPPIGAMPRRVFGQDEARLEPGDRLFVFSDGAFEIRDTEGRERGLEDFERELVATASGKLPGDPRRVYERVCAVTGTDLLLDDFTLLAVELDASASA
ncbi:MAG TPA: SpoIIE family protein phosphatase [Planctomycetota bacterium]|jgi:serine phosphatase RsbU (regulator of sigma subunit)|nr:SpoIIE family protein phosphatase [Planctomycetota bacterium]